MSPSRKAAFENSTNKHCLRILKNYQPNTSSHISCPKAPWTIPLHPLPSIYRRLPYATVGLADGLIVIYLITGSLAFKLESSHSGRARAPLEDSGQVLSTVDKFSLFRFLYFFVMFFVQGSIYGTSPVPVDSAHLGWLTAKILGCRWGSQVMCAVAICLPLVPV